jgi:hypothetical protein
MKIQVWKDAKPENVLRLRLVQKEDIAQLCIVKEDGTVVPDGRIADVTTKGLRLWRGIDPAYGFPLDRGGRIQLLP